MAIIQWTWTTGSPSSEVVDANVTPKKYKIKFSGNVRYNQGMEITKVQFLCYAYQPGTGGYEINPSSTQNADLGTAANEATGTYANRSATATLRNSMNSADIELLAGVKFKVVARITSKIANGVGTTTSDYEAPGYVTTGQ